MKSFDVAFLVSSNIIVIIMILIFEILLPIERIIMDFNVWFCVFCTKSVWIPRRFNKMTSTDDYSKFTCSTFNRNFM